MSRFTHFPGFASQTQNVSENRLTAQGGQTDNVIISLCPDLFTVSFRNNKIFAGSMHYILLVLFLLTLNTSLYSQQEAHIYGFVKDFTTGEILPGATIYDKTNQKGVVSDHNGYYNFKTTLPVTLQVAYVGYSAQTFTLKEGKDTLVNFNLKTSNEIEEVVVAERKYTNGNISSLSRKELMQIPALGGKPDVVKALQLLPGINMQTEGTSLLQVRGGDPGQNLYLFDNVPIIYVNHLGGFTSVFNPEIINTIDVYKGAFPAKYGGKLSSVVDITQRKGDNSKLKGNYTIGFPDMSFCLEGPTKLDNSSFIITARKTVTEPFMFLASSIPEGNSYSIIYGFHDLNGKFSWNPNPKNSFYFNLYYGDDYLDFWHNDDGEKFKYFNTWGNTMVSGHWDAVVNPKLYSKTSISYSRYRLKGKYEYELENDDTESDYLVNTISSISDVSLNSSLKHTLAKNIHNEYGLKSSLLSFLPFYSNQNDEEKSYSYSNETALYADSKLSFLKYSDILAGIRGVGYFSGDYSDYSIEPRLNLNLGLNKHHSINAGYMSTKQYSHLLLTSGSIMLNEVWIPSGNDIDPSLCTQYNVGYSANYDGFLLQVDLYYKEMSNLATYKEGYTAFESDANWLTKVEANGHGTSKGIEIFAKKTTGKITGFMAYTLSRTVRQYPGINDGKEYLFDFDRTHAFSVYAHYKITDRLDFNVSWVYQTGLPYTPALGKAYYSTIVGDETVYYQHLIYGDRNSERMRDYHRLDIGLNYKKTTRNNRKAILSFSIYNVYCRQNPYYYYYNTSNTGEFIPAQEGFEVLSLKQYQITYFPIIPALSYKVFFEKGERVRTKKEGAFKRWLYMED